METVNPELEEGDAFAQGRYELTQYIGGGSFGEVWRAHDSIQDEAVALKILLGEWLDNPVVTERFEREIRAAAKLQHPGIVQIIDTGYSPDGRPFYAMELVDGHTLDHVTIDLQVILNIYDQFMAALAYAHARGVIHRDLKPENILIFHTVQGWQCKILDFGIARLEGHDIKVTGAGMVLGTPIYMSPEQAFGEASAAGPASDLYSAGVMLYELLSGRVPFEGEYMALVEAHLLKPPPPLTPRPELKVPIQPQLEALVLSLMEKRYIDRPESAAAVRERLKPILGRFPAMLPTQRLSAVSIGGPMAESTSVQVLTTHGGDGIKDRKNLTHAQVKLNRLRDPVPPGRSDEKAILWETALRVMGRNKPAAVVMTGPPGMGKTRLCRWLAEMGLEHGMLRVFKIVLSDQGNLPVAMHSAVYRMLHYPRLERQALTFWIDHTIALPGPDDTDRLCDFLLSQLSIEADEARTIQEQIDTWSELWWEVISHKANVPEQKPLMVWVDIPSDGIDPSHTAAWIYELLERAEAASIPLLVLASAQTPADTNMVHPSIQVLCEHKCARHVNVGPLTPEDQANLAKGLVPNLSESAISTLVNLAQGSPFFSRELLLSWLESGTLVTDGEEWTLEGADASSMPERLEDLVADKIANFLSKHGADENAAYQVLMTLAALGDSFPLSQAQMVCKGAGLRASDLLREFILEQRRGGREPEYAFATGLMRQILAQRARAMGLANIQNRQAISIRLAGALDAVLEGDWALAERSINVASRLLDTSEMPATHPDRLHALAAQAYIAFRRDEREALKRVIEMMTRRADMAEDDEVSDNFFGPSELWSGALASAEGDLIKARRHYRNARVHAIVGKADMALLWALLELSRNAHDRGDARRARVYLDEAIHRLVNHPQSADPIMKRWFRLARRSIQRLEGAKTIESPRTENE